MCFLGIFNLNNKKKKLGKPLKIFSVYPNIASELSVNYPFFEGKYCLKDFKTTYYKLRCF